MGYLLNVYGEEYMVTSGMDSGGTNWDVGLYDDASVGSTGDAFSDTDDLGQISTEPGGSNYARQQSSFSTHDADSDSQFEQIRNDNAFSWDTSDSSGNVDSWFLVINFQSNTDGSPTDHAVLTGGLDQEYDLGSVDTLDVSANDLGVELE